MSEKLHILGCAVGLLALLAGCATERQPPAEPERLVWPAPPQPPRIQFVRSVHSDADLGRDTTFSERLANFLGGEKPPPNRIVEPIGVAVSRDGRRLYVSDYGQATVFLFDFARKTVTRIGADTTLAQPNGLALDNAQNLYVVETGKKGVSVFDPNGKLLRFITDASIERPTGIAIDPQRRKLYLADTGHSRSKEQVIKVFDLEGKRIGTVGHGRGAGEGQFMFPTYLAVGEGGHLFVTDTLNSRVQEFDDEGRYVRRYGERGNAWGMFDKPKGIALDSLGNLYVVDSGWSNVQIFNRSGQILLFFGGRGPIPGMLRNPTAIAIDGNNRIYVGDYINHRIEVYQLVNTTEADSFLERSADAEPGAAGTQGGRPIVGKPQRGAQ